jgi:hypothetical protein
MPKRLAPIESNLLCSQRDTQDDPQFIFRRIKQWIFQNVMVMGI